MPYVYVLNGRHRHRVFELGPKAEMAPPGAGGGGEAGGRRGGEAVALIGAREDGAVVLKDPWVSWTHARIVSDAAGYAIEDLGSTNGTYVNCERIRRQPLGEDDVIFLGRTHLLFVSSGRPPSAPPAGMARPTGSSGELRDATRRLVVPGARQEIPALDVSQDSALYVSGAGARAPGGGRADRDPAPAIVESEDAEVTAAFRGPFSDAGRIDELDIPEPEIELPLTAELSFRDGAQSDDHIEIDVAELGLGPDAAIGEAVAVQSLEASEEMDPRDLEIARLRSAVAARDAEIERLRADLTKLKEQYLDL